MRLAIITTHPIQYYAPVFKLLQESGRVTVKVFYTWGEVAIHKHDPGFGKTIDWDLPLLEGYSYEWLKNTSTNPGSSHFKGIVNPDAIQKINDFQPDVILVYGWAYQSHLKILRYYKGKIPVWFRGDSNLLDKPTGWKALLKNVFLRWVYRHIDKAMYVGSANKAYFKKYGLKESQLVFVPHAIDNARFAENRDAEASDLRKKLNIGESDILILFAGKLETKKDPEILLNAFVQLNRGHVHLLFVGSGILEDQLKSKCITLKHHVNIHFLPFKNQKMMPVIYQSCDLFCLPSKGPSETWGLAVNEAMAAGKAVLVSDKVGCAHDLVKHGENGYIFKNGDPDELLDKLKLMSGHPENLRKLGSNAREIIKNWSFEIQTAAIYKELNEHRTG